MATTTSTGHARTVDVTTRVIQRIQGVTTPDHVVPHLVGMGMPVDEAMQLADQHDEQRIVDALDAVEELGDTSRIINRVGWVRAAVRREWNLTGVLAARRENERRLAALDADRSERAEALNAFPAWRAISERWDRAISAALTMTSSSERSPTPHGWSPGSATTRSRSHAPDSSPGPSMRTDAHHTSR